MSSTFSSRPRLVFAGLFITLVTAAAFLLLQELYVIPRIYEEHEKRVETLPIIIATANQQALVTNNIAALRASLRQIMENTVASGVRYIFIQDAGGNIMAEAFAPDIDDRKRAEVLSELRLYHGTRPEDVASGEEAEKSRFDMIEKELGTAIEATGGAELAAGQLPRIDTAMAWRFINFDPPLIDYTVPIMTGTIKFGGVRVGVGDDAGAAVARTRALSYSVAVILLIIFELSIVFVASNIDSNFEAVAAARANAVRAELDARIKQLEIAHTRSEEENPIAPSEFLALLDFARKVSGTLDYNEVLSEGIHACLQIMNVRDASIFVMDHERNEIVGRIGHDENGFLDEPEMSRIRVGIGQGDIGAAAEFGTTTTIDTPKAGSGVVAALVAHGRTIGVLLVRNKVNGRPFIKKDQTVLRIFSGLLANAMENTAYVHHLTSRG